MMTSNNARSSLCNDCYSDDEGRAKEATHEKATDSMEGQQETSTVSADSGFGGSTGTTSPQRSDQTFQYTADDCKTEAGNRASGENTHNENMVTRTRREDGMATAKRKNPPNHSKGNILNFFGERKTARFAGLQSEEKDDRGYAEVEENRRDAKREKHSKESSAAFASQILELTNDLNDHLGGTTAPMNTGILGAGKEQVASHVFVLTANLNDPLGGLPAPLPTQANPMEPAGPGAWRVARSNFDARGMISNNSIIAIETEGSLRSPNEDLAVANPVTLPSAQEMVTLSSAQEMTLPKSKTKNVTLGLILIMAGAFVLVGVPLLILSLLNGSQKTDGLSTTHATTSPSMSPESLLLASLPEDTIIRVMESVDTSPQAQAYQWLLNDPYLEEHYHVGEWKITQRFALATLYYATRGDHWSNNTGWLSYHTSECNWFGNPDWGLSFLERTIEILESVHDFPEGPCGGSQADEYQHLLLSFNKLRRQLPEEVYLLTNLRYIYMIGSQLSGTLSSSVAKLSKLEMLGIALNGFTGTLPTELGLMKELKGIYTFDNEFSGSIPTELAEATALRMLLASENSMTGEIPTELFRLSSLENLRVQANPLTGQIPTQIGLTTNLTSIALYETLLSGRIPSEIGLSKRLFSLKLFDNSLTGTVPMELFHLTNIERFEISFNQLSEWSLPSEIGLLRTMSSFRAANSSLTGTIPTQMGLLHKLKDLSLQDNFLSGTIPDELSNASLKELNLLRNPTLTGVIPADVCHLESKLDFDCPILCGCDCPCTGN